MEINRKFLINISSAQSAEFRRIYYIFKAILDDKLQSKQAKLRGIQIHFAVFLMNTYFDDEHLFIIRIRQFSVEIISHVRIMIFPFQ